MLYIFYQQFIFKLLISLVGLISAALCLGKTTDWFGDCCLQRPSLTWRVFFFEDLLPGKLILICPLRINRWKMYFLLRYCSPFLGDMLVFGGVTMVSTNDILWGISHVHFVWVKQKRWQMPHWYWRFFLNFKFQRFQKFLCTQVYQDCI